MVQESPSVQRRTAFGASKVTPFNTSYEFDRFADERRIVLNEYDFDGEDSE